MARDERAYLLDVFDACISIRGIVAGETLEAYLSTRPMRSAVERELLIVGEAVNAIGRIAPGTFSRIGNARSIVDFRNQLAHAYALVSDEIVWSIAREEVPILEREVVELLGELGEET